MHAWNKGGSVLLVLITEYTMDFDTASRFS